MVYGMKTPQKNYIHKLVLVELPLEKWLSVIKKKLNWAQAKDQHCILLFALPNTNDQHCILLFALPSTLILLKCTETYIPNLSSFVTETALQKKKKKKRKKETQAEVKM